jgi:pyruvate dehydrogenase E2 component (dihydrolipoamide acetyltransferase)
VSRSFRLPDLGEGVHEGEVLAVHVTVGQRVTEGDLILEVETDKAAVEIPSPFNGEVLEIRVKPGDWVSVGDVMMTFSDGEEARDADLRTASGGKAQAASGAGGTSRSGDRKGDTDSGGKLRRRPVPASPATRRLARKLEVDLHDVSPSGRGGIVTAEDVRDFAAKKGAAATVADHDSGPGRSAAPPPDGVPKLPELPDFSRWGEIERVPFRSIRRATARQMSLAWAQIPHVNSQDAADVTRLEEFRQKHKREIAATGGKLSLTVFVLKAVASALKIHPQFNASLDSEGAEIVLKKYFHIGVAVNTEDGLMVPVLRDVDRKSIKELAIELNATADRARRRKTTLEEMQGGSFTITNAGAMGGGCFAPIINYPEVAIMGMGQARRQPVVRSTEDGHDIVVRLMMPLVLTIDHRVLDGAHAVAFLQTVIKALEDPEELLMSMT